MNKLTVRKSSSIYNPHWIIEKDGDPIVHIYTDAFENEQQIETTIASILKQLTKTFTGKI